MNVHDVCTRNVMCVEHPNFNGARYRHSEILLRFVFHLQCVYIFKYICTQCTHKPINIWNLNCWIHAHTHYAHQISYRRYAKYSISMAKITYVVPHIHRSLCLTVFVYWDVTQIFLSLSQSFVLYNSFAWLCCAVLGTSHVHTPLLLSTSFNRCVCMYECTSVAATAATTTVAAHTYIQNADKTIHMMTKATTTV